MKKAFSLVELMIVIVIIGVIYTLAITQLKSVDENKLTPNLANLKEYLSSYLDEDASIARLICLDDCRDCSVYVDGKKVQSIEKFLDETVMIYRYDFLLGMQKKKDKVYFNDENIQENLCFSFDMYKNNISEQTIVLYKEKVYDYSAFFEKTPIYSSLEELQEFKEKMAQRIMQ